MDLITPSSAGGLPTSSLTASTLRKKTFVTDGSKMSAGWRAGAKWTASDHPKQASTTQFHIVSLSLSDLIAIFQVDLG